MSDYHPQDPMPFEVYERLYNKAMQKPASDWERMRSLDILRYEWYKENGYTKYAERIALTKTDLRNRSESTHFHRQHRHRDARTPAPVLFVNHNSPRQI